MRYCQAQVQIQIQSRSSSGSFQLYSLFISIYSNSKSDNLDLELMLFSLCHPPPKKLLFGSKWLPTHTVSLLFINSALSLLMIFLKLLISILASLSWCPVYAHISTIIPSRRALGIKVGWVLESSGSSLSDGHWIFQFWHQGAEKKGFEVGNPIFKNTTKLTVPQGWIHSD